MFVLGLMLGGTVGFVIYALCFVAGRDVKRTSDSSKDCKWCKNHKGKSVLQFSVIDDDFGQYVRESMIKFCPFCGRKLGANNDR